MSDEHQVGKQIVEYWHVITGCTLALVWAGVRVKRRIRNPVVRLNELDERCDNATRLIEEHEAREIARAEEYREENMEAHRQIGNKVDNLTTLFIKHIDK